MLFFIFVFLGLQALVLFCCLSAGNDDSAQALSDQEQMEFIQAWKEQKGVSKS